jgi:hypothetical protein
MLDMIVDFTSPADLVRPGTQPEVSSRSES